MTATIAWVDGLPTTGITVYMRPDVNELARVLRLVGQSDLVLEKFNANFVPFDPQHVNGLDRLDAQLMRVVIIGTSRSSLAVERLTKRLNRLIDVYKIVVAFDG